MIRGRKAGKANYQVLIISVGKDKICYPPGALKQVDSQGQNWIRETVKHHLSGIWGDRAKLEKIYLFHNHFVAEVTQHVVMWPHQDAGGLRNIVQCYAEKEI